MWAKNGTRRSHGVMGFQASFGDQQQFASKEIMKKRIPKIPDDLRTWKKNLRAGNLISPLGVVLRLEVFEVNRGEGLIPDFFCRT